MREDKKAVTEMLKPWLIHNLDTALHKSSSILMIMQSNMAIKADLGRSEGDEGVIRAREHHCPAAGCDLGGVHQLPVTGREQRRAVQLGQGVSAGKSGGRGLQIWSSSRRKPSRHLLAA